MKFGIAQLNSYRGDISRNIQAHMQFIELATSNDADIIVFPELSLTGYEPKLAGKLATNQDDKRFEVFQAISDLNDIAIGVGIPAIDQTGIRINMIFFQPHKVRQPYSKQYLHTDEIPYFVRGQNQLIFTVKHKKIAPAICYESLLHKHADQAIGKGAEIYMTSVAKSAEGVAKAFNHYPEIAKKYSIPVVMSNCTGTCDNFKGGGKSSAWNNRGELIGQLNDTDEGILIADIDTEEVVEIRV